MTDRPIVLRPPAWPTVLVVAQGMLPLGLTRALDMPWELACFLVAITWTVVLAAYWRVRVVADEESVTVRDVYTTYRLPWRDIAAVDVDRAAGWHLRARTLRLRTAAGPVREARVTAVGAELVHAMWLEHRGPHWRPTPVPVGPWYPLPTWPRVAVGPAQPPPDADPRWPWTPPGSTTR